MNKKTSIQNFEHEVVDKYKLYNSIFLTLPFGDVQNTGVMLPILHNECKQGFEKQMSPTEIVESFFDKIKNISKEEDRIQLLFKMIQFVERQIVLFDALEDAAFDSVNSINGVGTLNFLSGEATRYNKRDQVKQKLEDFKVRIVLTAHPTQFYPGNVLAIINDLTKSINNNKLQEIHVLLKQLGKTPFFKKIKPTPFDEAKTLIWYLENVFYYSITNIYDKIKGEYFVDQDFRGTLVDLGFWPGGDRDGNPYVDAQTTLNVAKELQKALFRAYYKDFNNLKRRLTFKEVDETMQKLKTKMYSAAYSGKENSLDIEHLIAELQKVRDIIVQNHDGLFVEELDQFLAKLNIFGFHFATLDIRQDSRVHTKVLNSVIDYCRKKDIKTAHFPDNYETLGEDEKIKILTTVKAEIDPKELEEGIVRDTIESIYAIKEIQKKNGERGANRYIISNCRGALNMMELFAMFSLCGFEKEDFNVDLIPLFETVDDLERAPESMSFLYNHPIYKEHLLKRRNKQTIMLGYSDGTKDGGYLMANWGIYKAKANLTAVSRENDIKVVYFDGRGGPPARGGGKTHKFYNSLGKKIENEEIQLTVQGQTISSNFGTKNSSQYNLEQLLTAGVLNEIFDEERTTLTSTQENIMQELADVAFGTYTDFKAHPKFLPYLEHMSTLKYYGKTNIGSRPSKRGKSAELKFDDLRAIPFVGSWSQLKQNVPGYFGVGTALKSFEENGRLQELKDFYAHSLFFRTLLENSMMSLTKSFLPLTKYMENDPVYGEFWKWIEQEYNLSIEMLKKVSGMEIMENEPEGKKSIEVRENIVLSLITIQQYALKKVLDLNKEDNPDEKLVAIYEKMVTRSLYGNINASRNSA